MTTKSKKPPKLSVSEQQHVLRSMSQTAAAQLVGRNPSWLRDNPDADGRNPDGTYDVVRLVAWLLKNRKAEELRVRRQELAFRREEINAEKDQFELDRKKGRLVDIDEVVSTTAAIVSLFRERLCGIADKIAPSLSEQAAQVATPVIKREVARHLTWLSEEIERRQDEIGRQANEGAGK